MNHWIHLPEQRVLSITGKERLDFLQGLVTQDVYLHKEPLFSAFLNSKGFFHSDFFIIQEEERVLLECAEAFLVPLKEALSKYAPLHDVCIEDVSHDYGVCVALGDSIEKLLEKQMTDSVDEKGSLWWRDPRHPQMGVRAFVPYQHLPFLPHPLLVPGLPEVYHHHRIRHSISEGSRDLVLDKSVILEYGYHQMNAISWTKGCYRGQELMARTYHRGDIRKAVFPISVSLEESIPSVGTPLYRGEEKAGLMGGHVSSMALVCLYKELWETLPACFTVNHKEGQFTAQKLLP
jgi:folate-binding protein YgfZ